MIEMLLKVLVMAVIIASVGVPLAWFVWFMWAERRRLLGIPNGIETDGLVSDLRGTGSGPEHVRIDVIVTRSDGLQYPASIKTLMSPVDTPKFQPGARIRVKYDPDKPERVIVVAPKLYA